MKKYLFLARQLKKSMDHEDVLDAVPTDFEKIFEELEIKEKNKTTLTITLLRLARILRNVLETWDLLPRRLQCNSPANIG